MNTQFEVGDTVIIPDAWGDGKDVETTITKAHPQRDGRTIFETDASVDLSYNTVKICFYSSDTNVVKKKVSGPTKLIPTSAGVLGVPWTLKALVMSITGQDKFHEAVEQISDAAVENFLDPQEVINALHEVQKKVQG
jgi:hypothetical protein